MANRFKKRPLSFSQLSSWEWDKEQWYNSYILGIREPATPGMIAGNKFGDMIGTKEFPIPELQDIGTKEYKLEGNIDDIYMVGYADGYDPYKLILHENKTSDNLNRWNQKKVNEHGQLTMYLLLLYLSEKVKPEEVTVFLNFIPLERGGDMIYRLPEPAVYHQFPTKRTGVQLLQYAQYIADTVKAMDEYVKTRS